MKKIMLQKKKELECYEKFLNGIIAVNIGVASFPVEQLSSGDGFLNAGNGSKWTVKRI
jgi:hypothetical protein